MRCALRWLVACLGMVVMAGGAVAQKPGGILKMYSPDSPASMSILEESTLYAQSPMMGVFNNLVMFDQSKNQGRPDTIVPDLATAWSWNGDGTQLTLPLHQGVKWHDGKPFTARDVLCTFDLIQDKAAEKLRINPRKTTFHNLDHVTANGDFEVTFHLKRPQPAFPMLLANGFSAIYPCHVSPAAMRRNPIGTGPFKFKEFIPNEVVTVVRNPDYWKPGRPYLDGIEYKIIRNVSTATLAFVSGNVDMTFVSDLTVPVYKDVQKQVPEAICELNPNGGINRHLLINRAVPPFDKPEMRRALSLSIDRQAFVDIVGDGDAEIGAAMQPPPGGTWGMPPEMLKTLPGYDPDVEKNRAEARRIMQKYGYGPNNRLKVKVTARNIHTYKLPATVLLGQLNEIYVDPELELIETAIYYPRMMRKDFTIGLSLQLSGPDPDPIFDQYYSCGSNLNNDGFCDAEIDKLIDLQSREPNRERRQQIVWDIERRIAEDGGRPIIFYNKGGTCWRPHVHGIVPMVDSLYNGNRREDVWLDR